MRAPCRGNTSMFGVVGWVIMLNPCARYIAVLGSWEDFPWPSIASPPPSPGNRYHECRTIIWQELPMQYHHILEEVFILRGDGMFLILGPGQGIK